MLDRPGSQEFWAPAVRLLGIEVFDEPTGPEGFEAIVMRIAQRADAVLVRPGPGQGTGPNAPLIGAMTARYGLPGIFQSRSFVEAGGLIAYEARSSDLERRAGDYVDRILRGARPADLPVELPSRYDLIVNLRTARALGHTFSPAFIAQVDESIE